MAAPSDLSSPSSNAADARSFAQAPVSLRRYGLPLADGYLGSQVLAGFWRGLLWFVGLFVAFVLVSGAQKVAQQKMPLSLLVMFIGLQLPRIIVFTIPASLLFGTVSTFTEMSARGEVTAFSAGGMSLFRMLRAPFLASIGLAVAALFLQEIVVPGCELKRGEIGVASLQSARVSDLFPRIDKDAQGGVAQEIRAEGFDAKTLELTRPLVWINHPDGSALQITAERAFWDDAQKAWVFENGVTRYLPPLIVPQGAGSKLRLRAPFVRQTISDVALDPHKLTNTSRSKQDALSDHNFEMVSLQELIAYRRNLERQLRSERGATTPDAGKQKFLANEVRSVTFGIHDKLAVPLIILTMVLVGAPLGVRPQRTATAGLALGLSLVVLLAYYVVWTLVTTWGKGGGAAPILAAYTPFGILLGLGLFLTWKKN